MSLLIDPERVSKVLLADGWHVVEPKSFGCDSYEYVHMYWNGEEKYVNHHLGGQSDVCATGYAFRVPGPGGRWVAGPLTAVLAVEYTQQPTPTEDSPAW